MDSVRKPVERGRIRSYFGKKYFIAKRLIRWYFSGIPFAEKKLPSELPFELIIHSSQLLRPLKDVEMWMQHNKVENLKLAVKSISGVIIKPGETFSFWYLVGNPSKRRGYKVGMNLKNGRVEPGYGGGLCQLGNLIYWMALHTPLTVKERWRHSYDVFPDLNRKLPFGSGATLSYNYIDLQLRNDTKQDFQLVLWLSEENLNGKILSDKDWPHGYKVEETGHLIRQEFWGGYTRHNQIVRKVLEKSSGEIVREELVTQNHAVMMYNPLIEGG
jgi:vancomycin resistance protein VanW